MWFAIGRWNSPINWLILEPLKHKGPEMRRLPVLVAFVAIVGCLILRPFETSAQNAETKPQSPKWEYKVCHVRKLVGEFENLDDIVSGLETSLNDLGANGWELCLEINGGVILKRPR